jgi:hypothetical protein
MSDVDWGELFSAYDGYAMSVMSDDPAESINLIRELADQAPDEQHLAALAICLVETFIHQHDPDGFPLFEAALRQSPNLRKAWSHCAAGVPDEWERRFDAAGNTETP